MTPQIRPAALSDLSALTALYNHYVTTTAVTFDIEPFTVEARRSWFDTFDTTGPHRLFVAVDTERGAADLAVDDGTLAGCVFSGTFKTKPAYATTVESSIYVAPNATGRGLGPRLYETLFDALGGLDLHRVFAGIALPNPASIALHERFGFQRVGVLDEVGRKFGRYWSVAWYEKHLDAVTHPDRS